MNVTSVVNFKAMIEVKKDEGAGPPTEAEIGFWLAERDISYLMPVKADEPIVIRIDLTVPPKL